MEKKLSSTMRVAEAAKELRVTRTRIYQLINEGVLKLVKGRPTRRSVENYKINRNPVGRPEGSFKKIDPN